MTRVGKKRHIVPGTDSVLPGCKRHAPTQIFNKYTMFLHSLSPQWPKKPKFRRDEDAGGGSEEPFRSRLPTGIIRFSRFPGDASRSDTLNWTHNPHRATLFLYCGSLEKNTYSISFTDVFMMDIRPVVGHYAFRFLVFPPCPHTIHLPLPDAARPKPIFRFHADAIGLTADAASPSKEDTWQKA